MSKTKHIIPSDNMPNQSLSSPADKVGSNSDLVTQILLRVPISSVLRFKSVSKHYYSLISSHNFKLMYTKHNPNPPTALFVPVPILTPYLNSEFVQLDIENPVKPPFITPNVDSNVNRIDIEDCCNGLLLCSSDGVDKTKKTKYYICNPTINQFVSVPEIDVFENSREYGVTLVFDPVKAGCFGYKVVYVCCFGEGRKRTYRVGIYESGRGVCKASCWFELDEVVYMHFGSGVYWNNAVHFGSVESLCSV